MPIYEYQCKSCGHSFEKLQKLSDDPLKTCPECGKSTAERLVSAAGFQLKGTGWYVTDFRDDKKGQANSSKKDEAKAKKEDTTT